MVEIWSDIESAGREVVSAAGGNIIVEWTLDRIPDANWTGYLTASGVTKSGSLSFIYSEPTVSGRTVRLSVPTRDLENAVRYVDASIRAANEKYRSFVLPRQRLEAEQQQAEQTSAARQLQEARDRLKGLD